MRSVLLAIVVFLVVPFSTEVAVSQSEADGYVLVFSDEFNLPDGSQPDPAKWKRAKRYHSGWNRWISDSKDVVYIQGGHLVCKAIPNKSSQTDTAKMLTGAIESVGLYDFQYGKVEVRMKTTGKRGNFPAVWLKPVDGQTKQYGEIDIVETFGDMGVAQQSVHTQQTYVHRKKGVAHEFRTKLSVGKWHVYGMEWTPTKIVFTIDGKVTAEYTKSANRADMAEGQWTFDRPFYLIMNQSVGTEQYKNLIPDIQHTYVTQFDWIRVFQKK